MDDDDKVRRNLMVVSTAVLAYFWFALPDGLLLQRLFGTKVEVEIDARKVWIAIVAILVYQMHRYYAVGTRAKEFKTEVDLLKRRANDMVLHEIETQIVNQTAVIGSGYFPKPAVLHDASSHQFSSVALPPWSDLQFIGYGAPPRAGFWNGSLRIKSKEDTLAATMNEYSVEYDVPKFERWKIVLKVAGKFIIGPQLSDWIIPVAVWVLALICSLIRLEASI